MLIPEIDNIAGIDLSGVSWILIIEKEVRSGIHAEQLPAQR